MGCGGVEIWTDGVPLIISSMSTWICPNEGVSNKKCSLHRWRHPSNNPGSSQKQVTVSF